MSKFACKYCNSTKGFFAEWDAKGYGDLQPYIDSYDSFNYDIGSATYEDEFMADEEIICKGCSKTVSYLDDIAYILYNYHCSDCEWEGDDPNEHYDDPCRTDCIIYGPSNVNKDQERLVIT